jgi:ANTAR domain
MGILMLTHGVSADGAFELLAWRSKETNTKLRTIAARFVAAATASGVLPPTTRDAVDDLLRSAHEERTTA